MSNTEKEIQEGNRLIAKFMGAKTWERINEPKGNMTPRLTFSVRPSQTPELDDVLDFVDQCKYHTSWDWLHVAYKKFFAISDFDTVTDGKYHNRSPYFAQQLSDLRAAWSSLDIDIAFHQLVKSIKWYNTQPSSQG